MIYLDFPRKWFSLTGMPVKQVIWKNDLLDLIRAMFIKTAITQLIMGLSENLFHLSDPWNPLYHGKFTMLYLSKGQDRMGLIKSGIKHTVQLTKMNF